MGTHLHGLKNVLQAQADSQRALLLQKLKTRKAKRIKELQASGISYEQAEDVATEEFKCNDDMLTKELEKTLNSEQTAKLKMSDEDTKALKVMKNEKHAMTKNIASGQPLDEKLMIKAKETLQKDTDSDIERLKRQFKKKEELIMGNVDEGDRDNELAELNENMERGIAAIKKRHDDAMDILTLGHAKSRSNQMKRLEDRLAAERAKKMSALKESGMSDEDASNQVNEEEKVEYEKTNDISENIATYVTDLLGEGYDENMRKILLDHEVQVQGLENVLDYHKAATEASLQRRLKRKIRARELTLSDLSKDEREKILNEEFKADKKRVANAILNVEKEIRKKIETSQNSLNSVKPVVEQRLRELSSKEAEEFQDVGSDFSAALLKSAKAFTDYKVQDEGRQAAQENQRRIDRDVKKIRSRRDKDIEGIKTSVNTARIAKEEELRSKLKLKRSQSKSDLMARGLDEKEAEEQSTKEFREDLRKQLLELNSEFQDKMNKAVAEAIAKAREEERAIINNTLREVCEATKAADGIKDRSLAELERIKKEQEEEKEKLEATLSSNRVNREKALKERLAKRKAKKLENLSKQMETATEEEKEEIFASVEGEIIREEQEDLAQFHKDFDEEEERIRKEHAKKLDEIQQKAAEEARLAEIAAAEAAAREDALRAAKEAEERMSAENASRELQRLKDEATREAEKNEKEAAVKKSKGKGNLEARLAAKRAQKEKELKEREEREQADLEAKHEEELQKAENAKNAKNLWMKALEDAKEKAKSLAGGLVDKALYDFLVSETIGKKLVPDEQMYDALNTIFESKHVQEETDLIYAQYDERVAALKPAVEKIQTEMKVEREALLEQLENEKADETTMKK